MSGESMEDDKELQNACFELARTTKWVQKPIDAEELRVFAERLVTISRGYLCEPLRIDVPLIARAVRYLHGFTPFLRWKKTLVGLRRCSSRTWK
jgi:hypothetical protein